MNASGVLRQSAAWLFVPMALPFACAWVAWQERRILKEGVPLDAGQLGVARALGVARPERIRLLVLPRLPLPHNALMRRLGLWTSGLSTETIGLSARYGIFLRSPYHCDSQLLAHELIHTRQYERLGGLRPFLRQYLRECFTEGYLFAPLEQEARDATAAL